jgi:hypothetical protein
MRAEKALKKMHDAVLENKYEQAIELALVAIAETRLTYLSLVQMKEQASARESSRQLAVPDVQRQTIQAAKAPAQKAVRPKQH